MIYQDVYTTLSTAFLFKQFYYFPKKPQHSTQQRKKIFLNLNNEPTQPQKFLTSKIYAGVLPNLLQVFI